MVRDSSATHRPRPLFRAGSPRFLPAAAPSGLTRLTRFGPALRRVLQTRMVWARILWAQMWRSADLPELFPDHEDLKRPRNHRRARAAHPCGSARRRRRRIGRHYGHRAIFSGD